MENNLKFNCDYINLGIFGEENSGKCSLAKNLTINFGKICNPNNFSFLNKNYFENSLLLFRNGNFYMTYV